MKLTAVIFYCQQAPFIVNKAFINFLLMLQIYH